MTFSVLPAFSSLNPLVSVIMPLFNAEATLLRAIESIQRQSFTQWEMIVYDDGSTDASFSLAQMAARDDARIRVIADRHQGIVVALQESCALARGQYLARMDADDEAMPLRLEAQLALLEAQPDIALCGTQVRMQGESVGEGRRRYERWINALNTPDEICRELFVECPLPHPTFFMRRDAYHAIGGYRQNGWPEDYDLVMRFGVQGTSMAKVATPLLHWHDTEDRLSMCDARYNEAAFRRLKRHYLKERYFKHHSSFCQWGAGDVGKRWLREWDESFRPYAVVDVNSRKIAQKIHGVSVVPLDALPPPGSALIVVMVGAPGARKKIRTWCAARGYRELKDYVFLA